MSKIKTIIINNIYITINTIDDEDYINLTEILKTQDSEYFISNWLRNKNTMEFIRLWEELNNPNFNYVEFDIIKQNVGLNSYRVSIKQLISNCNVIGLQAKTGKYGGTYAHIDIALEFCSWLNPTLKLHIITEYKRLKKEENDKQGIEWNVKRELAKTNYHVQNHSVAKYIISKNPNNYDEHRRYYKDEANLLNDVLFNMTAEEWRDKYPDLAKQDKNIRDYASENELTVLANLETHNAQFIKEGITQDKRKSLLTDIKNEYLVILNKKKPEKAIRKQSSLFTNKDLSSYNKNLKKALDYKHGSQD